MAYKDMRIYHNEESVDGLQYNNSSVKTICEIGEDNICMPIYYKNWAEKLYKFEVRNEDTFVFGFPRSGTTWLQELVWLIVNDLDFVGATESQSKRIPYFEMDVIFDLNVPNWASHFGTDSVLTYVNQLKSPRVMKTHLHWSLLPEEITNGSKTPKIIFISRNPKDVLVSYFYLSKLLNAYQGSFEDLFEDFLAGRVRLGPYWKYILSIWKQRHLPNILTIKYEELIKDLSSAIKKVASFLDKPLSEKQVEQLVEHLSFLKMKNNRSINPSETVGPIPVPPTRNEYGGNDFIREGKTNGYVAKMTPELIKRFDEWTEQQLKGTGLIMD